MSNYNFDGIEYPSVTTVLGILDKPALVGWAAGLAVDWCIENKARIDHPQFKHNAMNGWRDVSKQACDIGSEVHHIINNLHQGHDTQSERPEVQNAVLAHLDWEKQNAVTIEASEVPVHDKLLMFAGTLDAVAIIDGERCLIDYKTSKAVYNEYKYQVAAYARAWDRMHQDKKIKRLFIVRLDKETGESEVVETTKTRREDEEVFKTILMLYYQLAKRRLKGNYRAANRGAHDTEMTDAQM